MERAESLTEKENWIRIQAGLKYLHKRTQDTITGAMQV
jgi:hypothetical protein